MLLSKIVKNSTVFFIMLTFMACGFEPIYKEGKPAATLLNQVEVNAPADIMGFTLSERLVERFGRPQNTPRYRIDVAINVASRGLAITQDDAITRYNLTGIASYSVTDLTTGIVAEKGTVKDYTAYNATASSYAGRVAEKDARKRLATSLADKIALKISATANRWMK